MSQLSAVQPGKLINKPPTPAPQPTKADQKYFYMMSNEPTILNKTATHSNFLWNYYQSSKSLPVS